MSFGTYDHSIQYDSPQSFTSLQQFQSLGGDWVTIVFMWYQDNINSTRIYPSYHAPTPDDTQLTNLIQKCKQLGLKVMLKPMVDPKDQWRAWIGTYFTDEEWTEWFSSYTEFIVHYAQLSEKTQVDMYSAGCEMITPSAKEAQWRAVIASIRENYKGLVTYSANWGTKYESTRTDFVPSTLGGEIDDIKWIDALDIIGIDAYYPLTTSTVPDLTTLVNSWVSLESYFSSLSQKWQKDIIFTELGYRSVTGGLIHPGWANFTGPVNITQQVIAYESVFMTVAQESWFQGVFWWMWDCNPNAGGPRDDEYSPQNKPEVLALIKKYYTS